MHALRLETCQTIIVTLDRVVAFNREPPSSANFYIPLYARAFEDRARNFLRPNHRIAIRRPTPTNCGGINRGSEIARERPLGKNRICDDDDDDERRYESPTIGFPVCTIIGLQPNQIIRDSAKCTRECTITAGERTGVISNGNSFLANCSADEALTLRTELGIVYVRKENSI